MKRILYIIIFILLLLLYPLISFSLEKGLYDHFTYWRYSGDTLRISWDPVLYENDIIVYEVNIYHCETEQVIIIGETQNTFIDIKIPRVGHYIFKVRSWTSDKLLSSEWAESIDSTRARVNGENKSFWVYGQLPKVTGTVIE